MPLRLYLAGPDVFRPQPAAYGEALKALCAAFGFTGLYPLDNTIAPQGDGPSTAAEIYRQNVALIDSADAVLANVADFRGYEPDSGTCFAMPSRAARMCGAITCPPCRLSRRCRTWTATMPTDGRSKTSACRAT